MTDELVLYTNPMSRGRIARWMLEEVGAPYRTEVVEYGPAMRSAAFLAMNPMGKVPVLTHGPAVVTETAAICAYLADAFPEAGLAPPPAERAAYYRWLFFAAGPLEAARIDRALGVEVPADRERMVGYGSFARMVDVVDGALGTLGEGWIAGPAFSAADVYLGAGIAFGLRFGTLEPRPAFTAYVERLTARPAFRRANAADEPANAG